MMRLQFSLLMMFIAAFSSMETEKALVAAPESAPSAVPHPAPVDEYAIAGDGGLVYDPLRREALKTGQLAAYARRRDGRQRCRWAAVVWTFKCPNRQRPTMLCQSHTRSAGKKAPTSATNAACAILR